MRTRQQVKADIDSVSKEWEELTKRMSELRERYIKLKREDYLISDETQWYEEKEITEVVKRRPKKEETFIEGRVYWKESFMDEDKGEPFEITRSMRVKKNGEWI